MRRVSVPGRGSLHWTMVDLEGRCVNTRTRGGSLHPGVYIKTSMAPAHPASQAHVVTGF